jgi:hypothetical protein
MTSIPTASDSNRDWSASETRVLVYSAFESLRGSGFYPPGPNPVDVITEQIRELWPS